MLDREELIEQAYFYRVLSERVTEGMAMQDLLLSVKEEILATTRLPMAIDYLLAELLHLGALAPAMQRLGHYFTPFQTYLIAEAEDDRGRFDFRIALEILRREAEYRAEQTSPQGTFLYQFETLCRNRLNYDRGLKAISDDPIYDEQWRDWVLVVRRQVGIIDIADLLFVRSEYFVEQKQRHGQADFTPEKPILFGEREGKIAMANRQKDPLLLFAALQRHLDYPAVPKPETQEEDDDLVPQLARRIERLEARIKLMEEEQRQGSIDLSRFYEGQPPNRDM